MTFAAAVLTDHGSVSRRTRGATPVATFENSNAINNQKSTGIETAPDDTGVGSSTKTDG